MNADREAWTAYAASVGAIAVVPEAPAPNKFHAIPIHVDGIRFASQREAARYLELKLMEKAGLIADLELQPVFPLYIMELFRSQVPIKIADCGKYTADFRYCDLSTGEIVVEDVKSAATKTTDYRLRKTIAEHVHGMYVRELE